MMVVPSALNQNLIRLTLSNTLTELTSKGSVDVAKAKVMNIGNIMAKDFRSPNIMRSLLQKQAIEDMRTGVMNSLKAIIACVPWTVGDSPEKMLRG